MESKKALDTLPQGVHGMEQIEIFFIYNWNEVPFGVSMARSLPLLALLLVPMVLAGGSISSATLRGTIQGGAKAQVVLLHPVSGFRQSTTADAQGRFTFHNLPFNDYHLEVKAPGYEEIHQDVELRVSLPVDLRLKLEPVGATVEVRETLSMVETHPTVHLDVDSSLIRITPAVVQSRAMEAILLATPGFLPSDNGRFHFRGSHGQMTYVIDGIPLSDQTHATFSNSLDPAQVQSLEILTGGIPAEYGGKPVAVVNLTTRSGLGSERSSGEASFGTARDRSREGTFSFRTGTPTFGAFITGAASRTDRFLDPPDFNNLHNTGHTGRLFSRLDWLLSERDTLRASFTGGSTQRDVVNLPSQQARGANNRVRTTDLNLSLAWSRLLSDQRSLEASLFFRRATSILTPTTELQEGFQGGGPDQPVWARQQRSLENRGFNVAYTQRFGADSTFKTGIQLTQFPLDERFRFAIPGEVHVEEDSGLFPFTAEGGGHLFHFHARATPALASAYAQTDLHLGKLFVSGGLRFDRWTAPGVRESEVQPRAGLSYTFGTHGPTLRASADRLLITPDRENLALSSSAVAAALGTDPDHGEVGQVEPVRPEVQTSLSMSLEHQLGKWGRVMVEVWRKQGRNSADVEQFLNTGIEFPIAFARGHSRGYNLRVDLLGRHGWSGYLSLGRTRAEVEGPMVGGLGLHLEGGHDGEETSSGSGRMLVDHDQKLAGQLGVKFERQGSWALLQGRYDSGLVAGDPEGAAQNPDLAFGLRHIRWDSGDRVWRVEPRTLWDLSLGHSFKLKDTRTLELSAHVLNLGDRRTVYNFLSHRGGTHVYPCRTVALRVKLGF